MRAAIYSVGTVNVTRGSANITGRFTAWSSISPAPLYFKLIGTTHPIYHVSSVNSNTSITLTVPYGGSTANRKTYMLLYEVTTNLYLPIVDNASIDPEVLARKSIVMVSNKIRNTYDL